MQEQYFPEFNITIKHIRGVSPVGDETQIIARHAKALQPKTALDMGCGTGFISIYLKKQGIDCEAADINPNAIELTKDNAKKNNIELQIYHSDLFQNISKKYDLITFNAPYGNTSSAKSSKVLEFIKSFIPKKTIITKISYYFIRNKRKELTRKFIEQAQSHLNENGKCILLMNNYEIDLLKDKNQKILEPFFSGQIVLVEGGSVENIRVP